MTGDMHVRAARPPRPIWLPLGALALVLAGAYLGYRFRAAHPPAGAPALAPVAGARDELPRDRYELARLRRLGVQFTTVHRAARTATIDVSGTLSLNRERAAEVSSHAEGRLTNLHGQVGQVVRAGQLLGEVESPAVAQAASDFLVRRAELETARRQLVRERVLLGEGATAERNVELAQAAVRTADAHLSAARTRLEALGVRAAVAAASSRAPLVAPISGEVIRREGVVGSWVQPQTAVFVIADLASLWAELDVFESDLGHVREGDAVSIDVPSLGRTGVPGVVQHIHAEVDSGNRMGRVRITIPNPDGRLRAGLSIAAHIHPSGNAASLRVPAESVRDRAGRPHVLVAHGNEARWTPVEPGPRYAGEVEVVRGLDDGDLVAVSGLGLLAGAP